MSDNRARLSFTPIAAPDRFVTGEKLTALKLNAAFQSAVNTAFLIAAAPPVPGMFRPWWWREEANRVELGDDRETITVSNLFVSIKTGLPLFVEHEEARFDGDDVEVFLTPEGKLETRPSGGELADREGLRIAMRRRGAAPRIDVPVAELGATTEIRAANERVCRAAGVWFQTALGKSQDFEFMDRLAFLRRGDALPERQTRSLSEVASVVRRRLGASPDVNLILPVLEMLVQPPESMAHDALRVWLTNWAETFESETILRSFFDSELELAPEVSLGPKSDSFWYEFDISLWNARKVELIADRSIHEARISFENFDGRNHMNTMTPLPGGRFSVSLDCSPDSTSLNVLANSDDIVLRLRLVQER